MPFFGVWSMPWYIYERVVDADAMPSWSGKPVVLRPAVVGMRTVDGHTVRARQPEGTGFFFFCLFVCFFGRSP